MLSSQFSVDKSAKPRIKSAPRYRFFYGVLLLSTNISFDKNKGGFH